MSAGRPEFGLKRAPRLLSGLLVGQRASPGGPFWVVFEASPLSILAPLWGDGGGGRGF